MMMSSLLSPLIFGLFLAFEQPLILVILLVLQTIPIILIGIVCSESAWLSYLTFLIYLGGLLIIFVYISALIPNQLISLSWFGMTVGVVGVGAVLFVGAESPDKTISSMSAVVEFTTVNSSSYIFLMIVYLLLILFSVAGLTNFIKSPLKAY